MTLSAQALLHLLQLASPTLPIGSYSYSEGLEWLVESGQIRDPQDLQTWLTAELTTGSIRIEGAVMLRAYRGMQTQDRRSLRNWNHWFLAARETAELRQQSCQMGQSLAQLLATLDPTCAEGLKEVEDPCALPIAFGVGAVCWGIPEQEALLGYFHSWANNLINAGIRLGLIGQTQAQQMVLGLQRVLVAAAQESLGLPDEDLSCFSLGLSLASMAHETQYSRLFRS